MRSLDGDETCRAPDQVQLADTPINQPKVGVQRFGIEDVAPAGKITALITEQGVISPVTTENVRRGFYERVPVEGRNPVGLIL